MSAPARPAEGSSGPANLDDTCQFITFTVGASEYGVDIMAVREIKAWTETTTLPRSPAHVRGVINLRGAIVPIFDLRARFGQGPTETTRSHVVIIVAVGARLLGLLVDTVSDILTTERSEIRAVPDIDGDADFLAGLVAIEERMVTLISLGDLFRDDNAAPEAIAA